ncbi:MAG: TVP38/TMEM64 family protein [Cyanothece sp. SIO1E1]|nr:TVP38/TMEM64 family protein [Cyanothece sp. SIO1E1]
MNPHSNSYRLISKYHKMLSIILATTILVAASPALAQEITQQGFNPQAILQNALTWIESLGPLGPIAFMLLYVVITVAFVPATIATLGAGVVFGVVQGSIYVFFGAMVGATAAFLIGRYVARDWIAKKIEGNQKFKSIDDAIGREGLKIIFLIRLSPAFPFNLLNYALGLTQVPLKDYVIGTTGILPGTVMYVYLGSLAGNLATLGSGDAPENAGIQWAIRIIGFIATVAVTVYVTKIARKALQEAVPEDASAETSGMST